MSNFFSFENDIDVVGYPFDPSRPFRFKTYGGTSFFSLSGYSYIDTQFKVEKAVVLPKGQYQISIDKDLKGRYDEVVFQNSEQNFSLVISSDPQNVIIEKQIDLDLVILFNGVTHYLFGDNYSEQEDYGKDYSIQIKLISGGLYEREKTTAVLKGDINKDGILSIEDLLFLRIYLLGAELEDIDMFRYDLNGDGLVDSVDLLLMRKYLSGTHSFYDVEYREDLIYE